MPTRRNCRPSKPAARPVAETHDQPTMEAMRRWPHPIAYAPGAAPATTTAPATAPVPTAVPTVGAADPAVTTQLLEQLELHSQLLVDLLAAVNGLTAATLAQGNKG